MVDIRLERHTLKDWFELLWITVRPARWRLLPVQRQDKADLMTVDLYIIERIYHGIWFDRTRGRYLKVELRRRALKGIRDLLFQGILPWKSNHSGDFWCLYTWLTNSKRWFCHKCNKLQDRLFFLRFKICWKVRWKIKDFFSPYRRYYVRIPRKDKKPFVNIEIHPSPGHNWRQPSDTIIVLKSLIELMEQDPEFLQYGNGGFVGDDGSLWFISNCFPIRTQQ